MKIRYPLLSTLEKNSQENSFFQQLPQAVAERSYFPVSSRHGWGFSVIEK